MDETEKPTWDRLREDLERSNEPVGVSFLNNDPKKGIEYLFVGNRRYEYKRAILSTQREHIEKDKEGEIEEGDSWKEVDINRYLGNPEARSRSEILILLSQTLRRDMYIATINSGTDNSNSTPTSTGIKIYCNFEYFPSEMERIELSLLNLERVLQNGRKNNTSNREMTTTTIDDILGS